MKTHPTDSTRSWRRPALRVALLGALLGLTSLAWAANSRPRPPLLHLLPPENIAQTTRADLRARMNRHGNVMTGLVKAVVLLDRPTVTNMARRIADEELLARAESPADDPWRPLLPKAFFIEQDALRSAARELAQAAAQGDPDDVLAERFGALTRTCVRCHGSYLHDLPTGPSGR